jgi:hypothetical protein
MMHASMHARNNAVMDLVVHVLFGGSVGSIR